MRLQDAVAAYDQQLVADGRSIHARTQAARHARLLGRWMEKEGLPEDLTRLSHEDVARFMGSKTARCCADGAPKKATSTNALRSSLRTWFAYLAASGQIPSNPAGLLRRARCGPPLPKAPPREDIERVLGAISADGSAAARRDLALANLLLGAGPRIASALSLRIEEIDLERGVAKLRTKGDREQRLLLTRAVCDALASYVGDRATGWLFPGRSDGPLGARQARVRLAGWCRRAGVRVFGPHALRHRFALDAYARSGDVLAVQGLLGHASIASTVVYARAGEDRARAALGT